MGNDQAIATEERNVSETRSRIHDGGTGKVVPSGRDPLTSSAWIAHCHLLVAMGNSAPGHLIHKLAYIS